MRHERAQVLSIFSFRWWPFQLSLTNLAFSGKPALFFSSCCKNPIERTKRGEKLCSRCSTNFFCIVKRFFSSFKLHEIFFHFHFVSNSLQEETHFLCYSYVALGRVKTLFFQLAIIFCENIKVLYYMWKVDENFPQHKKSENLMKIFVWDAPKRLEIDLESFCKNNVYKFPSLSVDRTRSRRKRRKKLTTSLLDLNIFVV